jgi:hypothetical protein
MIEKYFYATALVLFFGGFVPALIFGVNGFIVSFALAGLSVGLGTASGIVRNF